MSCFKSKLNVACFILDVAARYLRMYLVSNVSYFDQELINDAINNPNSGEEVTSPDYNYMSTDSVYFFSSSNTIDFSIRI